MAESFIELTAGTGTKAHTWSKTVGANTVHDEFTLPGEYPLASYFCSATAISTTTNNSHPMQLMAGSSLNVRIRRIYVRQIGNAAAVFDFTFVIVRLTTAGTGGGTVTCRPHDTGDAASGATGMTLPTVKGTEGVTIMDGTMLFRQGLSTGSAQADDLWVWEQHPGTKPIIIPAGTSNGIAVKNTSTGGSCHVRIEFVETSF